MRPLALLLAATLAAAPSAGQTARAESAPASRGAAGTYFWFRMWPDFIAKFDPVTDTVVAKVQTRHGIGYDIDVTHDRKSIVIVTDKQACIEVIDIASAKVVDEYSFKQEGFIVRVQGFEEVPGGKQWYVRLDKIKEYKDHYDTKETEWVLYDLPTRKISGKPMKELPEAIRRGARISPDGTRWHVRGKDLVIIDPGTMQEEGKVELSRPLYGGMGPISLSGDDLYDGKKPGFMKTLYTMRDPVASNRTLAGVVEIDLVNKKIVDLKEWGWSPRFGGFGGPIMTRDRTRVVTQQFGRGFGGGGGDEARDPEVTLATYDLTTGAKLIEGTTKLPRSAVHLAAIAPDGSKTYFTGRGHEFIVLDAKHQYLKTVELQGEIDDPILPLDG